MIVCKTKAYYWFKCQNDVSTKHRFNPNHKIFILRKRVVNLYMVE